MPCNAPLEGWRARTVEASGKRRIVFRSSDAYTDLWVSVPCGKCFGCKLERSREWAVRALHEASLWPRNVFVTLTYKQEHLPLINGQPTLRPRDFVLFMKRLRRQRVGVVRFLHAGEYGKLGRPHHHALLFNCDFPDKKFLRKSPAGSDLFTSSELSLLWVTEGRDPVSLGFSSVGEVTFESAAYVARYTLKKFAPDGVGGTPGCSVSGGAPVEGAEPGRVAEYMTMSRGGRGKHGGLGSGWIAKYQGDVFPWDEVVTRGGKICKPPRFYESKYEKVDPAGMAEVKRKRIAAAGLRRDEDPRYEVKEAVLRRRVADFLKREV